MRTLLLITLPVCTNAVNAQLAKCAMPDGRMVWRNASDCPRDRGRETVRVDTPPPPAPVMSASQYDAARGATPPPATPKKRDPTVDEMQHGLWESMANGMKRGK